MAMEKKFKPIKLSDLNLSKEDMAKIAKGAALFMRPVEDDAEPLPPVDPLVVPRDLT